MSFRPNNTNDLDELLIEFIKIISDNENQQQVPKEFADILDKHILELF